MAGNCEPFHEKVLEAKAFTSLCSLSTETEGNAPLPLFQVLLEYLSCCFRLVKTSGAFLKALFKILHPFCIKERIGIQRFWAFWLCKPRTYNKSPSILNLQFSSKRMAMQCQKWLSALYLVHTQVKMKVKVSVINILTSAMNQITPCCIKNVVYSTHVSLC